MTEKLYYWAENLENYSSNNDIEYDEIIEIKRLNFFIGKNNAGKSKFLRTLFKMRGGQYLYNSTQFRKLKSFHKKIVSNKFDPRYEEFINLMNDTLTVQSYTTASLAFKSVMHSLYENGLLNQIYSNNNIDIALDLFHQETTNIHKIFSNMKFYIPILRGMRPVTEIENKQPYIERAQKDYFPNKDKFDSKNIITGECLYHELQFTC